MEVELEQKGNWIIEMEHREWELKKRTEIAP